MFFKDFSICFFAFLSFALVWLTGHELSYAHDYYADVDQAAWFVKPSRLSCKLLQAVPAYGQAVFERGAGENLIFYLQSKRSVNAEDRVTLESWAPAWKHAVDPRQLAVVQGHAGIRPVSVDQNTASILLAELQEGMFPVISHAGWSSDHVVEVAISSVNFADAYQSYLDCLDSLFPASFNQLVRSTVLFETDSVVIKKAYKDRMKLLAQYLEIDPSVERLFVDGHTDSRGRTGYNWDLSRRRAEAVYNFLQGLDIPKDKLVLRYHGELRPIAVNSSITGRQRNRRVTLRLQKESS